jgi:hypothetical protein
LERETSKIINKEKEKRKKFISSYGRIIPNDFIPSLRNLPDSKNYLSIDNELP